jgi:hypothetical protein
MLESFLNLSKQHSLRFLCENLHEHSPDYKECPEIKEELMSVQAARQPLTYFNIKSQKIAILIVTAMRSQTLKSMLRTTGVK